jgi:alkyl hydroperoxide reductase subunit AhpF
VSPLCDCGIIRGRHHGVLYCDHCDEPCTFDCKRCRAYRAGVARRLSTAGAGS